MIIYGLHIVEHTPETMVDSSGKIKYWRSFKMCLILEDGSHFPTQRLSSGYEAGAIKGIWGVHNPYVFPLKWGADGSYESSFPSIQ